MLFTDNADGVHRRNLSTVNNTHDLLLIIVELVWGKFWKET